MHDTRKTDACLGQLFPDLAARVMAGYLLDAVPQQRGDAPYTDSLQQEIVRRAHGAYMGSNAAPVSAVNLPRDAEAWHRLETEKLILSRLANAGLIHASYHIGAIHYTVMNGKA